MGIFDFFKKDEVEEIREDYSTMLSGTITGGGSSTVEVLEPLAEKLSTVVACTNIIAGTMSKLDIKMLNSEGLEIQDYRLNLLNGECSKYMLGMQLIENMTKDYLLYGSAYALKSTDGNLLTGLTYIHPNDITLELGFIGREPVAKFNINMYGSSFTVDPDELLIFIRQSTDGLEGHGVLHFGSNVIKQGINEQDKATEFFKNGALPTGVLKSQSKLSEGSLKRLRESWAKLFTGSGNAGKTVILEEGLEYQSISFNPETLQLLNSKGFTVAEICRLFNLPQSLVDSTVKGAYNSLEQQNLHYLYYTISPIIEKFIKSLNQCLLLEEEKGQKSFYIDTDDILTSSLEDRYKAHEIALKNTVKTTNEIRAEEGLPPLKGGDIRFIPLNTAMMDEQGNVIVPNYLHTQEEKTPSESDADALKGGEDE